MRDEPREPSESELDALRSLVESAAGVVPARPKRQKRRKPTARVKGQEQPQEREQDIQAYIVATRPLDLEPQPPPARDKMEQAALDLVRSIERFIVHEQRQAAWRAFAWVVIAAMWVVLILWVMAK
jgi:hypothetical protein